MNSVMSASFSEFRSPAPKPLLIAPSVIPACLMAHSVPSQTFLLFLWKCRSALRKDLGKPQARVGKREFLLLPGARSMQSHLFPLLNGRILCSTRHQIVAPALFPYRHPLSTLRSLCLYCLKILKTLSPHDAFKFIGMIYNLYN